MSKRTGKPVALRRLIGLGIAVFGIVLGIYVSISGQPSSLLVFGSFVLMVVGLGVAGVKAENIT